MATIELLPEYFKTCTNNLISADGIEIALSKNRNGVEFLHVQWEDNQLDILPFQGQQIWRACLNGSNITMISEVDEPIVTQDYLRNYGGFLVHCGATAMGGPSPLDTHPLHGELPNARYNRAWVSIDRDEDNRQYVQIHGEYKHQIAMTVNYLAHPVIKITQGTSQVEVSMTIRNMSKAPMDMMYLAHVNFAPVIGSRIEATHAFDADSIHVRSSFPAHIHVDEKTQSALKELEANPYRTANIEYGDAYDPEAVMSIDYVSDENGNAHSLQIHPDGTSDYLRHSPKDAPHAIRCIQLTDHHQCLGLVLPCTAGVEGYLKEKENGRIISLESQQEYSINFCFDSLDKDQTDAISKQISKVMGD